jgi:hypothetical protein
MEKQNNYLSQDVHDSEFPDRRPIESLLEIVKEDLNNYGECMIPVGMSLPFRHGVCPDVSDIRVQTKRTRSI